jgi:hypothetical protein
VVAQEHLQVQVQQQVLVVVQAAELLQEALDPMLEARLHQQGKVTRVERLATVRLIL